MKDQWTYANYPLMYIACSVGIILVLFQGTYLLRKALKASEEMGMEKVHTKEEYIVLDDLIKTTKALIDYLEI